MKFTLNFTRNDTYINDITAILQWNNTNYTPTKTSNSHYVYFEETITTGLLSYGKSNITFNWTWTADNTGGGNNLTNYTSNNNQSLYKMVVGNCKTEIEVGAISDVANINHLKAAIRKIGWWKNSFFYSKKMANRHIEYLRRYVIPNEQKRA